MNGGLRKHHQCLFNASFKIKHGISFSLECKLGVIFNEKKTLYMFPRNSHRNPIKHIPIKCLRSAEDYSCSIMVEYTGSLAAKEMFCCVSLNVFSFQPLR